MAAELSSTRPQPDADGLVWGFRGAFRAVIQDAASRSDKDRGKWISFLPSGLAGDVRQRLFDNLARAILLDPQSKDSACQSGKLVLEPLETHPERVALMFYCDVDRQDLLKPVVERHAKALRRQCLEQGLLKPRDGFLSKWSYKTDAQTQQELDAGTHPAAQERSRRLLLALFEYEAQQARASRPKKTKGPR